MPIHIPARKSGIGRRRIEILPGSAAECPDLLVPLTPRPDLAVQPAVKPGDRVEPLGVLARPGNDKGASAFSPAEAVVTHLTTVDTEYACELPAARLHLEGHWPPEMPAPALHELWTSTTAPGNGTSGQTADPQDLRMALADLARLEDLPAALDELGVLMMHAGRPEPMGQVLARAAGQTDLLVINAIQSEPRLASHRRLTLEAMGAVVAGTRAVMTYLGVRRATLLVSATHGMQPAMLRRLRRFGVRTIPVRTGYPGSDNSIVLRHLFNRSAPNKSDGLGSGGLVLAADAAWRAGLALLHRKPVPFQPVTVAGDCLDLPGQRVWLLPIGLTIEGLIQCLVRRNLLPREPRVILLGGPMTGTAIVDPSRTVITQATQAVLLMNRKPRVRIAGCIRCGWCIYGCPVGLDPIAILDALEAGQTRVLAERGVDRCIDCGVCSAICPSHLPLAQAARTARMLDRGQGRGHQ